MMEIFNEKDADKEFNITREDGEEKSFDRLNRKETSFSKK